MNVQFGNSYKFYQMRDARQKQQELRQKNIDSAVETRTNSNPGGLGATVMSYVVHTDEDGTTDLTDFRRRQGAE